MQPLRFEPILKRIRWGGRRLGSVLGKSLGAGTDYAESWELVDHGDDQSIVCDGEYAGWSLARLVQERGADLFGSRSSRRQFPLLLKFLDAQDHLSVQVHPNDTQARTYDPRENGKTEAWVILDALPDSRIFAGLRPGVDRETLQRAIAAGTVEECLHSFPARAGDCVFVPAGTVHALGAGVLLAEVQQASDLTFRLYDWGRVGTDGRPRQLHIEQSLACIDFSRGPVAPVHPEPIESGGVTIERLVECPYFSIRRYQGANAWSVPREDAFRVLMCVDGEASLKSAAGREPLCKGDTVLVPASADDIAVEPTGEVVVLEIREGTFLPSPEVS